MFCHFSIDLHTPLNISDQGYGMEIREQLYATIHCVIAVCEDCAVFAVLGFYLVVVTRCRAARVAVGMVLWLTVVGPSTRGIKLGVWGEGDVVSQTLLITAASNVWQIVQPPSASPFVISPYTLGFNFLLTPTMNNWASHGANGG